MKYHLCEDHSITRNIKELQQRETLACIFGVWIQLLNLVNADKCHNCTYNLWLIANVQTCFIFIFCCAGKTNVNSHIVYFCVKFMYCVYIYSFQVPLFTINNIHHLFSFSLHFSTFIGFCNLNRKYRCGTIFC